MTYLNNQVIDKGAIIQYTDDNALATEVPNVTLVSKQKIEDILQIYKP